MSESEPTADGRTDRETETDADERGAASPREAMEKAGPNADVPDEAIASIEDFTVQRDADGERLPVTQALPGKTRPCPTCGGRGEVYPDDAGLGDDAVTCGTCGGETEVPVYVRVVPINQGEANEYLPESGDVRALDDAGTLELLHEFYVEPSFEGVETLDEITAFGLDPLLMALMNASGFEMTMGMVGENSELVEMVEGNSRSGN